MTEARPARREDVPAWLKMRVALWPECSESQHLVEIERFFGAQSTEYPIAVLIAFDGKARAIGFAELSVRPHAIGCNSTRVAYLEGWFVVPEARARGVGRRLVESAESWGRNQRCKEFASDAEVDNELSRTAHLALGFSDVGMVRSFRKDL